MLPFEFSVSPGGGVPEANDQGTSGGWPPVGGDWPASVRRSAQAPLGRVDVVIVRSGLMMSVKSCS